MLEEQACFATTLKDIRSRLVLHLRMPWLQLSRIQGWGGQGAANTCFSQRSRSLTQAQEAKEEETHGPRDGWQAEALHCLVTVLYRQPASRPGAHHQRPQPQTGSRTA